MTRFLDGPAQGHMLSLARSPMFLRVVINDRGEVDALDQRDDAVAANETAYVYRLDEEYGVGFACTRGKGCKRIAMAAYSLHVTQPNQDVLRDNQTWQAWAMREANG